MKFIGRTGSSPMNSGDCVGVVSWLENLKKDFEKSMTGSMVARYYF
jgi:hypothetical protein